MNKSTLFVAVIIGIFGFVNLGMAAERTITASSLENAYQSQMNALESEDAADIVGCQASVASAKEIIATFAGQDTSKLVGANQIKFEAAQANIRDCGELSNNKEKEAEITTIYQFMEASLQ